MDLVHNRLHFWNLTGKTFYFNINGHHLDLFFFGRININWKVSAFYFGQFHVAKWSVEAKGKQGKVDVFVEL